MVKGTAASENPDLFILDVLPGPIQMKYLNVKRYPKRLVALRVNRGKSARVLYSTFDPNKNTAEAPG